MERWGSLSGKVVLLAGGGGRRSFEMSKVSAAAGETQHEMWQELRMDVATIPLQAATAVPIPASALVFATPALDVREACIAAKGCSAEWSGGTAPRACKFVVLQVPGNSMVPCAVACAGGGVEVGLVKVKERPP